MKLPPFPKLIPPSEFGVDCFAPRVQMKCTPRNIAARLNSVQESMKNACQLCEADMNAVIYKIFTQPQWESLQKQGHFAGSADDKRDGFIHLSGAGQLQGTLDKHYTPKKTGGADLILAAVEAKALGGALKYETSRGGQAFPHLFASLPQTAVQAHWVLKCGPAQGYQAPDTICPPLGPQAHHQQENS